MINVGIIQCSMDKEQEKNLDKIICFLHEAKKKEANLVVIPELFLSHYFCKTQEDKNFSLAYEVENNNFLLKVQEVCSKLSLVVPFSFYEKSGPNYFNSVAMIDADGKILGVYRKSHIPDGVGYQEKYYFRPGNTGFKVFDTKYAKIGVGICWDQWFPEAARIMALSGAEILCYPTAIGSEPNNPSLNTKKPWQRVMQGHAVSNMIPIAASNRVGDEEGQVFYGSSFICDNMGDMLCEMNEKEEGVKVVELDLSKSNQNRASFGFFRDRRVELYKKILE